MEMSRKERNTTIKNKNVNCTFKYDINPTKNYDQTSINEKRIYKKKTL